MEQKPNNVDTDKIDGNDFDEDDSKQVVDSDKDESNEDSTKKSNDDSKSQDSSEKEEKAKNARYAEERRKREAEEKAKREAREREIMEEATIKAELNLMKTNPFTQEPIEDAEDLKIYKIQKELDDEGKDPITDLPKRLAEIKRKEVAEEKEKKAKEEAEKKASQEKVDSEIAELRSKYPKLDTAKLANDPLFQECLKGRAGRWTQTEIYELYLSKKEAEKAKKDAEKNSQIVDESGKRLSSTPSASSSGRVSSKPVSEMTEKEFKEYWARKYGN